MSVLGEAPGWRSAKDRVVDNDPHGQEGNSEGEQGVIAITNKALIV